MTPVHPILAWRQSRGLNLVQVADMIGVWSNTVSRWERGRMPERDMWQKIEAATGITPVELVRHATGGE